MVRKCNGNYASVTRDMIQLAGGREWARMVRFNTRSHAKRAVDFGVKGGDTRARKFRFCKSAKSGGFIV